MVSKKQVSANRENAKKSTGPKTPGGKAKSAQNATTHGLTAHYDVIRTESQEDFDLYRHEMIDEMDPIGPMQHRLAERIVSLSWRLRRAEQLHNQTTDARLEREDSNHELALGNMAVRDFAHVRVLDKLIMYERRIENSLYKTMRELKKLKNEKTQNKPNPPIHPKMQNEPNLHDQMNLSPAITKDYSLTQPGELLQKIINQSRPKADSTNNQCKDVVARRNGGRSETSHYPIRPINARFNKK